MAPLQSLVAAALLFLSAANAHFEIIAPRPLEGDKVDESKQVNAPCGGGVPDLLSQDAAAATEFYVSGDTVVVVQGHAEANLLFRATLDPKAAGNWTMIFPIVKQSGRGDFCAQGVTAPRDWAGEKGFVGVVSKAHDGVLYQCAAVKFMSGIAVRSCRNGSSVSATFTYDPTLVSLVDDSSYTFTIRPDPSSTGNSAPSALPHDLPVSSLLVTTFMFLLGAALL